jgi:hypothetical protein
VIAELTYEPVPVPVEFIPAKDSASTRGNDTSDQQSPGVVQNTLVEAITKSTDESVSVPAQFSLPAKAIELDCLDCDAIPTLIASVLRGTNVNEFLERLEVLAYTGTCLGFICTVDLFIYSRNRQILARRRFDETTGSSL